MSIVVLPDIEALVGTWLRDHPDLQSLNVRVAGATPSSMTGPWIRVTKLGSPDVGASQSRYLIDHTLQLDCYAGSTAMQAFAGQARASLVARRARAILEAKQGQQIDGVVVTRVRCVGDPRLPDTTFEPAMERYVLTMDVMAHAVST